MATPSRRVDRRSKRTRQALEQAFADAVHEKGFVNVSIQDITERADVHRGTFYAHFTDKYALLDTIIRERLQELLFSKLPATSRWDRETLQHLILIMLEYFANKYHHQTHPPHAVIPLVGQVTREELSKLLLRWLKEDQSQTRYWRVRPETIARVAGWGIFGAAIEWSQEESPLTAEQMAREVLLVITEGIARLAPEMLPT